MKIIQKFKNRRLRHLTKRILKARGEAYAVQFNKKARQLNLTVRVEWNGCFYTVRDETLPDFSYNFCHERQGHLAYANGLITRANNLGAAYFLSKIDFKDGDCVFDCGANVGDFKLWFEINKLKVDYVGFEPSPNEFACLQVNVKPGVAHNVGLWDRDGEMTFYVSSQGADSSLIEPPDYDEMVVVQSRRLEQYIDRKIKLLKLEAEGAEPEILNGIGENLDKIEYITADLGFERGLRQESTLVPVINYLLARDFELIEVGHRRICALFKNRSFNS